MDSFISIITGYITPILIVIVLVILIIFLLRLIKVTDSLNETVVKTQKTMDLTNESLEKVQAPLNTAVNVSHTIDDIHSTTINTVKKVKDTVNENLDDIVSGVGSKLGIKKKKKANKPSPDDIIKGA